MKRVKKFDSTEEKNVITGLIVDDSFCMQCLPLAKIEYFKLKYAKPIIKWIKDYYDKYEEAPKKNLETLFDNEKKAINKDLVPIVESFLSNVSTEYETTIFNTQYQIDQAKNYFKKRKLEILHEKTNRLLKLNKIQEAVELQEMEGDIDTSELSDDYNPLDAIEIKSYFLEEKKRIILNFAGALGRLVGGFERNNLIAVTAPEKRGKTWWLQELAFQALIQRNRVAWFSLEMNKEQTKERFYAQLTGRTKNPPSHIVFPIFDCLHNQTGECELRCRTNNVNNLLAGLDSGEFPDPDDFPKYNACTVCRGKIKSGYRPEVWYAKQNIVEELTLNSTLKKSKNFINLFNRNIRIKNYPAFSAGSGDIDRDLKNYIKEGFNPDIVIVDYIDIQRRSQASNEREAIHKMWRDAKKTASELNCVYVTADQADADARKKNSLDQNNFSDDKRKDGVLDCRIGINQTHSEKERGIQRMNVIYRRMGKANVKREVQVLQCLELGQPCLDSEFL